MILPALYHRSAKSTCHIATRSILNSGFFLGYCTTPKNTFGNTANPKLPEAPQNCCMSGCGNCVWIAYAQEVAKILNDEGETAEKIIMEHVKDPNLRAFLMLELQDLFKRRK